MPPEDLSLAWCYSFKDMATDVVVASAGLGENGPPPRFAFER